jgi:hypothetical protein
VSTISFWRPGTYFLAHANYSPVVVDEPPQSDTATVASAIVAAITNFANSLRRETELPRLVRQGMTNALVQSADVTARAGHFDIGNTTPNTQVAVDVVMEGFNKLTRDFIRSLAETGSISGSPDVGSESNAPPPRIPTPDREKWFLAQQILREPTGEDISACDFADGQSWDTPLQGYLSQSGDAESLIGGEIPVAQWLEESPFDNTPVLNPTGTWMGDAPPWYQWS